MARRGDLFNQVEDVLGLIGSGVTSLVGVGYVLTALGVDASNIFSFLGLALSGGNQIMNGIIGLAMTVTGIKALNYYLKRL